MSKMLTLTQAARRCFVSVGTLRNMIRDGRFPQPIRQNQRWIRVPEQDVKEYLERLETERVQRA